jgi:solute carrier family 38 (sodium-coupled neutral amino acid transporter), member 9
VPTHLIQPEEFFLHNIPGVSTKDHDGKHSSFVTIFSCWNGMAGTSMVTVPWAFQQSGIVLGSILTFIAFSISYFTCYLVVLTAKGDLDYTDTLKRHFGRAGWIVGMVCFCLNLYVPILLFF